MCVAKRILFLGLVLVVMNAWVEPVIPATIPQAKPDQGLVVFYRLNKFAGKAIRFNVNHSEGYLGQLLAGTVLYKYVDPGTHAFWSQVVSKDSITLNVEAGKTYYVKGEVRMGVVAGRPTFVQMPEARAKADLANL